MRCVVIQTAFLGDAILTVPLLALLRRSGEISWLGVLASPPGASFLMDQGLADSVIPYDKRARDAGLGGFRRIVGELRLAAPDVALVPHRSFRSSLMALASGASRRIGFDVSGGRAFLTEALPYRPRPHEIERVASLAGPLGVAWGAGRVPFDLTVPEVGEADLQDALAKAGRELDGDTVVVAPGSRWATKRWLPARFAAAGDELARELSAVSVLVGAETDVTVASEVSAASGRDPIDLTGSLSLPGLLALVSRSLVVVSNDSAVAHMAAGLGVPVVAVFGPTVPSQGFAPYSERAAVVESRLECRPCGRHGSDACALGTLECMEGVSVEEVVARALGLVRGGTVDA